MACVGRSACDGAGVAGVIPNSCLLVIPSFRDAKRLAPFLKDLLSVLPSAFQIRVVDDGSGQRGVLELQGLIQNHQATMRDHGAVLLDPLLLSGNRGKGAAVYQGWRKGPETEFVAFADADGAVSATEIMRIWDAWPTLSADAVIASRVKMLGREVSRLPARHYAGRIFATLVSVCTGLSVYDSQCGFKLLRRDAFLAADHLGLKASRLAFDVELLVAMTRCGCRIVEFPVDWRDVAGGSVSLMRHSLPMILELMEIRNRLGKVSA